MPQLSDPSPTTATARAELFASALAAEMPSAVEIAVPACPEAPTSYSADSHEAGNPAQPPQRRRLRKNSRRPVRILCV